MPFCDGHQGQDKILQEVGLFVSPLQTTQGSSKFSLGTSIRLDADPLLEAEPPMTTYLLLLSYSRLIYL